MKTYPLSVRKRWYDAIMSDPNVPEDIRRDTKAIVVAEGLKSDAITRAMRVTIRANIKKMLADEKLDRGLVVSK